MLVYTEILRSLFVATSLVVVLAAGLVAQTANPLDPTPVVRTEDAHPTRHLFIYSGVAGYPDRYLGVQLGFGIYNTEAKLGCFIEYMFLARGTDLGTTIFASGRDRKGDLGLIAFGFSYVPSKWFEVPIGLSFGGESLARRVPAYINGDNEEISIGLMVGSNLHVSIFTLYGGLRYQSRSTKTKPSKYTDFWLYDIKLGISVINW